MSTAKGLLNTKLFYKMSPKQIVDEVLVFWQFAIKYLTKIFRWGAGVVERGGLENRCACKRTVGSNPTPPPKAA